MQRHGVRRFKEKKCKSAPMYGVRKGKPFNSPFYVCCEGEGGGGKGNWIYSNKQWERCELQY
jgi:hypothetical protein